MTSQYNTSSWRDDYDFEPGTNPAVAHAIHALRTAPVWPFPAPGGPVPWTPEQIRQHDADKRNNVGDALL